MSVTASGTDTLPRVSVFPPPVLHWRVVPQPDPAQVQALATALNLPAALAGLLVQRGYGTEDAPGCFLRTALSELSARWRLAGMVEAVGASVSTIRSGGR